MITSLALWAGEKNLREAQSYQYHNNAYLNCHIQHSIIRINQDSFKHIFVIGDYFQFDSEKEAGFTKGYTFSMDNDFFNKILKNGSATDGARLFEYNSVTQTLTITEHKVQSCFLVKSRNGGKVKYGIDENGERVEFNHKVRGELCGEKREEIKIKLYNFKGKTIDESYNSMTRVVAQKRIKGFGLSGPTFSDYEELECNFSPLRDRNL